MLSLFRCRFDNSYKAIIKDMRKEIEELSKDIACLQGDIKNLSGIITSQKSYTSSLRSESSDASRVPSLRKPSYRKKHNER